MTLGFGNQYSIQLSYGRIVQIIGGAACNSKSTATRSESTSGEEKVFELTKHHGLAVVLQRSYGFDCASAGYNSRLSSVLR